VEDYIHDQYDGTVLIRRDRFQAAVLVMAFFILLFWLLSLYFTLVVYSHYRNLKDFSENRFNAVQMERGRGGNALLAKK